MIPVLAKLIGSMLLLIVIKLVLLLVAIAYYTLAERKIMAAVQRRFGPNVVGLWGLLQPLADGLKLFGKELVIPSHANSRIFMLAPLAVLTFALTAWYVIPFNMFDHSEHMTPETVVFLLSTDADLPVDLLQDASTVLSDGSAEPVDLPLPIDAGLPEAPQGPTITGEEPSYLDSLRRRLHSWVVAFGEWFSGLSLVRRLMRLYRAFRPAFGLSGTSAPEASSQAPRPARQTSAPYTAEDNSAYRMYDDLRRNPPNYAPVQGPVNLNARIVVRPKYERDHVPRPQPDNILDAHYFASVWQLRPKSELPELGFRAYRRRWVVTFDYQHAASARANRDVTELSDRLIREGFYARPPNMDVLDFEAGIRAPIADRLLEQWHYTLALDSAGKDAEAASGRKRRLGFGAFVSGQLSYGMRLSSLRKEWLRRDRIAAAYTEDYLQTDQLLRGGHSSPLARAFMEEERSAVLNEARLTFDQAARQNPDRLLRPATFLRAFLLDARPCVRAVPLQGWREVVPSTARSLPKSEVNPYDRFPSFPIWASEEEMVRGLRKHFRRQ